MRYRIWFILVFLWANFAGHAVFAQDVRANTQQQKYLTEPLQAQRFDDQKWEKSIRGLDYSLKKKKPPKPIQPKAPVNFEWPELGKGLELFLKVLVFGLIIVVLALLLRHYLIAPKNSAVKKAVLEDLTIEEIEEHLEETELSPYIRKAIEQNDYALAVRLYYLEVLKQLSAQKAIHWRKNKTNRQYLQEMRTAKRYAEFRLLTLIFERVRYGGHQISQPEFAQIEPGFQSFLKSTPATVATPAPLNAAV